VETKLCRSCEEEKPLEEFYMRRNNTYTPMCDHCAKNARYEALAHKRDDDTTKRKVYIESFKILEGISRLGR
jgi:hypothetical protein